MHLERQKGLSNLVNEQVSGMKSVNVQVKMQFNANAHETLHV